MKQKDSNFNEKLRKLIMSLMYGYRSVVYCYKKYNKELNNLLLPSRWTKNDNKNNKPKPRTTIKSFVEHSRMHVQAKKHSNEKKENFQNDDDFISTEWIQATPQ